MGTEYDKVNVIHGSWSGLGGKGIAPSVTRQFAEELLRRERLEAEDYGFACQCLCQRGAMPLKVVETYIQRRTGEVREDKECMRCCAGYWRKPEGREEEQEEAGREGDRFWWIEKEMVSCKR